MPQTLIAVGDINLMNVADPEVPFRRVAPALRAADVRFANLECCLYDPPAEHSVSSEGFYAGARTGEALKIAGFDAVGNANNVNYGAEAIQASCMNLDKLGIPHTGAGADRASAYAAVVVERQGVRYGFMQRSSVYWPTNHQASDRAPGIATLQGHTAYQPLLYKLRPEIPPANRPGVPPEVITWADPKALAAFREDVSKLRERCDILVASQHWGLFDEVLDYMTEIAHTAIDAGADLVVGHGPHYSLAAEIYKDKPVFYGLGSFSFHTGHGGKKHGDWRGELAKVTFDGRAATRAAFSLIRHNEANETEICALDNEATTIARLQKLSAGFGTQLVREGDELVVRKAQP
jgi:poly-gamma-glutamate synthesis protein (capsule biosynthesis protein)